MSSLFPYLSLILACALSFSCGSDAVEETTAKPISDFVDNDEDGYSEAEGDCNDQDRFMHPGALDPCDGIDQNCDGVIDELFDQDRDGFTSCFGDCRDNDPFSNPRQAEKIDGIDNDCDGIIDNHTLQYDDDGDGYSEDQGDCNDHAHLGGKLIGPEALEVQTDFETGMPEGLDNDCDGEIDEAPEPFVVPEDAPMPLRMAASLGLGHQILTARVAEDLDIDRRSHGVFTRYGDTYRPRQGEDFLVLSSGIVGDKEHFGEDFVEPQSGTSFSNQVEHPDPQGAIGCSNADPALINDYTELDVTLKVPANARSFSFDFNFMSAEFPEFVCTSFDDTFLAILDSEAFQGNVSFDSQGNRMSINVGFFDVCAELHDPACTGDADLIGTGFEGNIGGGTGWLTTTAPVVPGEKIRLRFIIFDEGDHILDSAVIIDNFRWAIEEIEEPITVD